MFRNFGETHRQHTTRLSRDREMFLIHCAAASSHRGILYTRADQPCFILNAYRRYIMREFACKSLGYDCGWKQTANTEELLADVAAVHLRDVHNVPALTQEMVGAIKQAFSKVPADYEAKGGDPVLK